MGRRCPMTAASCSRCLSAGGSASIRAARTACTVGGTSVAGERPRKAVAAACALEHTGIDQRSHDLFDEERIPAGALHQEALERWQARVGAQQGLKEFREALAGEGIQTKLASNSAGSSIRPCTRGGN